MIRTLNLNRQTTSILQNAYVVGYEKEVNAIWQASFSLPINDSKIDKVKMNEYVKIEDVGLFKIMPKLTSSSDNSVTFQCEHVLSTLLDGCLFKYHQLTNYRTRDVIEYILDQQEIKHWELRRCDFDRRFHYSWENENGLVAPLFSVPKAFDEPYMWVYDTSSYPWQIDLIKPSNIPTARIKEGYNLVDFEIEENPMNMINRIYPMGAGEGVNQLTIESINNGKPYIENRDPGDEIRKYIWVDQRFTDVESLKSNAQAMLDVWKKPKVTWVANAADVSSITGLDIDKLICGAVVSLQLDDYPTVNLRIMKESKSDMEGEPGDVKLEIGNAVEDLGTTNADVERRQQINELYSQGATNIMNFTYQDNADSSTPATIPFYIDDDVVNINTIELSFDTKKFRAYSEATGGGGALVDSTKSGGASTQTSSSGGGTSTSTKSGGGTSKSTESGGGTSNSTANGGGQTVTSSHKNFTGYTALSDTPEGSEFGTHKHNVRIPASWINHSHTVALPNHSHEFTIPAHSHEFTIPAHTHDFTVKNHTHKVDIPAHKHEIELPDHKHEVEHKIVELDTTPSKVTIKVDGNIVPHTSTSGNRINLVDYMSKDNNGRITRGKHEVEILPSGLARIEADLICRVFIQSQLGGKF